MVTDSSEDSVADTSCWPEGVCTSMSQSAVSTPESTAKVTDSTPSPTVTWVTLEAPGSSVTA